MNTVEIPLTKGYVALIDEVDYDRVAHFKWHVNGGRPTYYAIHSWPRSSLLPSLHMHRFLLGVPNAMFVDHINHDGLDNRRINLRICTGSQNNGNRQMSSNNTASFKGVTFHVRCNKWIAQIADQGTVLYLGCYLTPEDAARAYDAAAIEKFGSFALTNAMLGLLPSGGSAS